RRAACAAAANAPGCGTAAPRPITESGAARSVRSRALRPIRRRLELRVGQKTRGVFRRLEHDQAALPIELHLRGERQRALAAAVVAEVERYHRVVELRSGGHSIGHPLLEVVGAEAFVRHE